MRNVYRLLVMLVVFISCTAMGNASWTQINLQQNTDIYGTDFAKSNSSIWLVGASGRIIKVSSAGDSVFHFTNGNNYSNLNSVAFPKAGNPNSIGYICGDNGIILKKSVQSDSVWNPLTSAVTANLYDISFYDDTKGICVGANANVLYTLNGGQNWQTAVNIPSSNYYSVAYYSDNLAIAVGDRGKVIRTTNGGLSWDSVSLGNYVLRTVYFVNQNIIYIGGHNGVVFKSTNGGTSWSQLQMNTNIDFLAFYADSSDNAAFAGGSNGALFFRKNINSNFQAVDFPTNNTIYNIKFSNSQNGYFSGSNAILFKTVDGGINNTPYLKLSSPNGNEHYIVGNTVAITWTARNIDSVRLEYTVDNGNTWNLVQNAGNVKITSETQTLNWIVPNMPSTQCRIRASELKDSCKIGARDESDQNFVINGKSIAVTKPIVGVKYKTGDSVTVEWSEQNIDNDLLQISYMSAGGLKLAGSNIQASLGTFTFVIPNTESEYAHAKIVINDITSGSTVSAQSAEFLIVNPEIKILLPTADTTLKAGSNAEIRFYTHAINSINIYGKYTLNDMWHQINSIPVSVNEGNNSFLWQLAVPDSILHNVVLKIQDISDSAINVTSSKFSIWRPNIKIIEPHQFLVYNAGDTVNISWDADVSQETKLKIELYQQNLKVFDIASNVSAALSKFMWIIPDSLGADKNYKIKITTLNESANIFDETDTNFCIEKVSLSRMNGHKIYRSYVNTLSWESAGVLPTQVEWKQPGSNVWYKINGTQTGNTMNWNVPSNLPNDIVLRVSDVGVLNCSDTLLLHSVAASLKITYPVFGESRMVNTLQDIDWAALNIDKINIYTSQFPFTDWEKVADSVTAKDGSYSLSFADKGQYKIKISAIDNPNVSDETVNPFGVSDKTLKIISPNGNEIWFAKASNQVQWTASTNVSSVDLYYSVDNGTNWNYINDDIPCSGGTGLYNWDINNIVSSQVRVKAVDHSDSNVVDVSDSYFTITGLKLLTPTMDETIIYNSQYAVKWNSADVDEVKLEYSDNNGNTWNTIVDNYPAYLGFYNWTVPSYPSRDYKIRIIDTKRSSVNDATMNFTVSGLLLNSPKGGELFLAGSTQEIQWLSAQDVQNIKIEFYTGNNNNLQTIHSCYPAVSGNFEWQVPKIDNDSCFIKITSLDSYNYTSVNIIPFKVIGAGLEIISPDSSSAWNMTSNYLIKWYSVNTNHVNISYSIDNGQSWNFINDSFGRTMVLDASIGSYNWTIPNFTNASSECFVKITDVDNPDIYAISKKFKITGKLYQVPASWTYHSPTQDDATIIVPYNLTIKPFDNRTINDGDVIGVFYNDNGVQKCAGYGVWTNAQGAAITVWGDDIKTSLKDGFALNENYSFRVWDAVQGIEYGAWAEYRSGNGYFVPNGISVLSLLQTHTNQLIRIRKGWSWISANKNPVNNDIEAILDSLKPEIEIVKDDSGNTYIPAYNNINNYVNTIKTWNIKNGYQIYSNKDDTLYFKGIFINPRSYEYKFLANKWYIISYLPKNQDSISKIFSSANFYQYSDTLRIFAKNNDGKIYYPAYGIDQIKMMYPGEGYKIFVTDTAFFRYPDDPVGFPTMQKPDESNSDSYIFAKLKPNHFGQINIVSSNNSNLIAESEYFSNGDEIAVINSKNEIIASATVEQNRAVLNIWGADADNLHFTADKGEPLKLKMYDSKTDKEINLLLESGLNLLTGSKSGQLIYNADELWKLSLKPDYNSGIGNDAIGKQPDIQAYPNPCKNSIRFSGVDAIQYYEILNNLGQIMLSSTNTNTDLSIDVSDLASGHYFVKLIINNKFIIKDFIKE